MTVSVSVELLLRVAFFIALVFLAVTYIWKRKSNNSLASRAARLWTGAALTAISVGIVIVRCLTGESYGFYLFLTFLWLLFVVLAGLSMSDK